MDIFTVFIILLLVFVGWNIYVDYNEYGFQIWKYWDGLSRRWNNFFTCVGNINKK
jgi:hypothetical protein